MRNDFHYKQRSPFSSRLRRETVRLEHAVYMALRRKLEFELRPIFIVGCGNTGTTLLASRLGNHPSIGLIPEETGMFLRSVSHSKSRYDRWFSSQFNGCNTCFLEKTPKHVQRLGFISSSVRDARVIVSTRAACFDIAMERWRADNIEFLKHAKRRNIKQIKFEEFTRDPERVLREVCDFCDLPWDSALLENGVSSYENNKTPGNLEIRKEQLKNDIKPPTSKWRQVLSPAEIEKVNTRCRMISRRLGYE